MDEQASKEKCHLIDLHEHEACTRMSSNGAGDTFQRAFQQRGKNRKGEDSEETSIIEHEGALIGSVSLSFDGSYNAVVEEVRQRLMTLVEWVECNDGVIGHAKATVARASLITMLSSTGDDVAVSPIESEGHTVEAVAIVFGIESDALEKKMAELF